MNRHVNLILDGDRVMAVQPAYQTNACDDLIDQMWGGDCNEPDFFERGMLLGMTLQQLGEVVAEIKNADGII